MFLVVVFKCSVLMLNSVLILIRIRCLFFIVVIFFMYWLLIIVEILGVCLIFCLDKVYILVIVFIISFNGCWFVVLIIIIIVVVLILTGIKFKWCFRLIIGMYLLWIFNKLIINGGVLGRMCIGFYLCILCIFRIGMLYFLLFKMKLRNLCCIMFVFY